MISGTRTIFLFLLIGCTPVYYMPDGFNPHIISSEKYDIFTYQKISNTTAPIHIYIEGDGNSYDGAGRPTSNPTPRGTLLREIASNDSAPNVVYMARPCQYIMSDLCRQSDWTTGRFSSEIIDSVSSAIQQIAHSQPIILIGYSGGALISGLVILENANLNIKKWITIAGVLNHSDWTDYFNDSPLTHSLDLYRLPNIHQVHYIASHDETVPQSLSNKWLSGQMVKQIPDSSHSSFPNLKLDFSIDKQ